VSEITVETRTIAVIIRFVVFLILIVDLCFDIQEPKLLALPSSLRDQ
jgi:hypothetical protein